MINYYCPGFMEAQPIYNVLFNLRKQAPECFYENVKIKKIFGNFPNMIWNGGTVWVGGPTLARQEIIEYFNWYAYQDVILQLICTNPVLEEKDVYDRYCNTILDIASQFSFVEILVSSPILESYIRNKYPHMKVTKSIIGTTAMVNTEQDKIENYIQLLETYDGIVLPKKYGKDLESLKRVPQELRNRIEILATDPCPNNCPHLYSHYQDYGRAQLGIIPPPAAGYCYGVNGNIPFRHWVNRDHQYNYSQLTEVLEPLGFTEIKLSGRGEASHVAFSILPYLIKPEYLMDVYTLTLSPYCPSIMQPVF